MSLRLFLSLFSFLVVFACERDAPLPKPRTYPRVIYPEKTYQVFDTSFCNMTFEYPDYARIEKDSRSLQGINLHPCWFDVYIPRFNCRLHCSYYEIGKGKDFEELKADAFELADWHNKKANYIDELVIDRGRNMQGIAFVMEGPAATPMQFYLTDGERHFFRGSLYFNTQIRPDSLAPLYDFVQEDVLHMIETFDWKD